MWIQGVLFGEDSHPATGRRKSRRPVLGHRLSRHAGWLPVTRDPDVALSHGDSFRVASDFRLGLAQAFGQIPPETRLAIRRAIDPARRKTAA